MNFSSLGCQLQMPLQNEASDDLVESIVRSPQNTYFGTPEHVRKRLNRVKVCFCPTADPGGGSQVLAALVI